MCGSVFPDYIESGCQQVGKVFFRRNFKRRPEAAETRFEMFVPLYGVDTVTGEFEDFLDELQEL